MLADIAHFSGLVAAGLYPNPFPHAHVVTTTTNKNLRGPHGALILSDDKLLTRRLDAAVFPGIQGGPIPELIAAKAVCFGEALRPEFKIYAQAVLENARALCLVLRERGYDIVTGGTDSPIVMVDLTSKRLTGHVVAKSLEAAGLLCNKIMIPGDRHKPSITSGLRFGTSAITTRGFKIGETRSVGHLIADVLDGLTKDRTDNHLVEKSTRMKVKAQWMILFLFVITSSILVQHRNGRAVQVRRVVESSDNLATACHEDPLRSRIFTCILQAIGLIYLRFASECILTRKLEGCCYELAHDVAAIGRIVKGNNLGTFKGESKWH